MTKAEIMELLEELEIEFDPSLLKAELEELLPEEDEALEEEAEEEVEEDEEAEEAEVEEVIERRIYQGREVHNSEEVFVNGNRLEQIHFMDGTTTILPFEDEE